METLSEQTLRGKRKKERHHQDTRKTCRNCFVVNIINKIKVEKSLADIKAIKKVLSTAWMIKKFNLNLSKLGPCEPPLWIISHIFVRWKQLSVNRGKVAYIKPSQTLQWRAFSTGSSIYTWKMKKLDSYSETIITLA